MEYRNILIVKLSAIGDVIHALPVAHALKQRYPQARLTWIVEKAAYELLCNNPVIDEVILFDKPRFKSLGGALVNGWKLSSQLRARRFDLAVDLQGLFKSAAIAWLSGARQRVTYCDARELSHLISQKICGENAAGHVVQRYLDVARHLGCVAEPVTFPLEFSESERAITEAIARQAGLPLQQRYIILAPGTNWVTKCWPPKQFAQLAEKLYDEEIVPVLIGGPDDGRLAREIRSHMQIPPVDLTGKTNMKQLAYIIQGAEAFVGGDTGPMHLAAALGTPVVSIFGPTTPARNGPYGAGHRIVIAQRDCVGCWKRECPKQLDCLVVVSAEEVYKELAAVKGWV